MGPIWDRQDPGGHHGCPMNFAIWVFVNIYKITANHKQPQQNKAQQGSMHVSWESSNIVSTFISLFYSIFT